MMNRLSEVISPHLSAVLERLNFSRFPWQKMLGVAREPDQGDIALPCFAFAQSSGGPHDPEEIAKQIADDLISCKESDPELGKIVGEISATGGYVNIRAGTAWMAKNATDCIVDVESIGRIAKSNNKVLIEHTSANPNGPFHVGRARNAIIGDTLVRMNRLAGNNVRAEYYAVSYTHLTLPTNREV